jgi:hypothetical protein
MPSSSTLRGGKCIIIIASMRHLHTMRGLAKSLCSSLLPLPRRDVALTSKSPALYGPTLYPTCCIVKSPATGSAYYH